MQLFHVPAKFTLPDAVPSNTPEPMVASDEQPLNAFEKLFPLLRSRPAGNEVSPLDIHALVKFTFVAAVPSCAPAGNDVSEVQDFHALVKLFPLLMSSAGKDVSDEQLNHALLKFTTLLVFTCLNSTMSFRTYQ